MKNFKKIKLLSIGLISSISLMAQQPPTNNNPSGNASGTNDRRFWSRAGNTNANGNNNIFGTMWNSPIYTYTDGVPRMKVNGGITNTINGHNMNRSGFVGIGTPYFGFFNNQNKGPYSLLHLNGADPSNLLDVLGHHDWMKTGITFTANHDLAYLGMRSVGGVSNVTEFTAITTYLFYN